ncbi:MAG: RNA-binding S4 domain-containing protein [Bacteroidota bacterium]|nr:RNA-binding S4 domain-containing protein [Bacteroidota bacterium]MDX5448913.1 RNA-binding S4 domain-containing protein [Bacteroidota bacterium]
MRIDKFLWCVRLFKTRSLAAQHVRSEKVLMDGEVVKASREIRSGDVFTLKQHGYFQTYEVLEIPKSRVGAKLVSDLILETTPKEELEKREFLQLAQKLHRRKGEGRPTKKDRRDLDNLDL